MPASDPPDSPIVWEDGAPRSRRHGDVYFSRDDGLAEARAVFLAGSGLPQAWAGRRRFTVAEIGFGTGLNIAALLDLWRRTRPPGGRLSVFTLEAFPLSAGDAERALATWPELAPVARLLTARWPGRARGFHRIDLPELAATVDVAIMEAAAALSAWDGAAGAWFLDGFAPTLDPEIWRQAVIDLVAARSAPGARAATYTVAGSVRRALATAGFRVERAPGHGRKRERLEARLPSRSTAAESPPETIDLPSGTEGRGARSRTPYGSGLLSIPADASEPDRDPAHGQDPIPLPSTRPDSRRGDPRVAIVGAGISGAALCRAFAALGVEAAVFDAVGPGAGGSGAPAALMAPRLDAGLAAPAALFAQAARTAANLYDRIPRAVIARGAVQLQAGPKDPARFAAIAASDLFEPAAMSVLSAAEASLRLGDAAPPGLAVAPARVVEPAAVLGEWLGGRVTTARVTAVERAGDTPSAPWRLIGETGAILAEADVVCVAAGMGSEGLAPGLGLTPVRGQATLAEASALPAAAIFGAYAVPTRRGVLFGATHDRGETSLAPQPRDRARNLAAVAAALPGLARALAAAPLADWTAVRATTSDYLPLAGRAPGSPGLWLLTGLGSRGFCLAPLLAEHLAAVILGAPSPLPLPLSALVDPARFAARAARKGRPRR